MLVIMSSSSASCTVTATIAPAVLTVGMFVMEDAVRADLQWLTPEEGGRRVPPSGPTYSTVAQFELQGEEWMKDSWSLVVTFLTQPDAEQRHQVHVRFLMPAGPRHWLSPGSRFWLREGARVVAHGQVTTVSIGPKPFNAVS
jgi:hypothetical protein